MEYIEYLIVGLPGAVAIIVLTLQLVKYVQKAVKEKNWANLVTMVMNYMAEAERLFENGADKKAWVMGMIQESAEQINYPIDMDAVSVLIDQLCDMSKKVNPPTPINEGSVC